MLNKLDCSIIVPTYNRVELLKKTLSSLVDQTYPIESYEVLVCDDGSTDATREIADNYANKLQIKYLYQEDKGYRVAKVRNLGIDVARGDVCIFIDSGVCVESKFVEYHLKGHLSSDKLAVIGMVYGYNPDEDVLGRPNGASINNTNFKGVELGGLSDARFKIFEKCDYTISYLPAPWVLFWGGNISVRKCDLVRVGCFDENFIGWGGEDLDLGYRLFMNGVRLTVDKNIRALHLPHRTDVKSNKIRAKSNYAYMKRKYKDHIVDKFYAVCEDGIEALLEINRLTSKETV